MKEKIVWTAEDRQVPSLRKLFDGGIVRTGDDISDAPNARQFVDQGLAEVSSEAPKRKPRVSAAAKKPQKKRERKDSNAVKSTPSADTESP